MLPMHVRFVENARLHEENVALRRRMRAIRNNSDPFNLPDTRFIELFRLTKDMVQFLINRVEPHISNHRASGLSVDLKVFAALKFFATGCYQRSGGQDYHLSMSQKSVGRSIRDVTTAIYKFLSQKFIKFPNTFEEKMAVKLKYMDRVGFPGVIGAIDCTHVAILKPQVEEHNYLNRKGCHSKNVQIVCNYDTKILAINSRYAGATHYAFIWRQSALNAYLGQCFIEGDHTSRLLGYSGYPLQPWLLTPIINALPGSPEERYTTAHVRARNSIERCIGILKGRFRCLLGELV